LRNGVVVQSRGFKRYQPLGNPVAMVRRLNTWMADELIYIDISPLEEDARQKHSGMTNSEDILEIIRSVSEASFMPLTFGGGIRNIEDINLRLAAGADKVTINTHALAEPSFITEASQIFGAQCIVVSIDVKINEAGAYEVMTGRGRVATGRHPVDWAKEAERRGAGEIFLNAIDRDGAGNGYDLELIKMASSAVSIPVIACGGVGEWQHFAEGIEIGGASAAAAANIFNYTEQSVYNAKKFLYEKGLNVRKPELVADHLRDKSSVRDPLHAIR
jgi:cyclase